MAHVARLVYCLSWLVAVVVHISRGTGCGLLLLAVGCWVWRESTRTRV